MYILNKTKQNEKNEDPDHVLSMIKLIYKDESMDPL